MVSSNFPCFVSGTVVKGFGRGSKELGIPTANYSSDIVNRFSLETGIYFGWAQVDNGPVHRMVMSVGWNPFYNNTEKTMEVHIIHQFDQDFYGSLLKICVLNYIRPEMDFNSVNELITQIRLDIDVANSELVKPEMACFRDHEFFSCGNSS